MGWFSKEYNETKISNLFAWANVCVSLTYFTHAIYYFKRIKTAFTEI